MREPTRNSGDYLYCVHMHAHKGRRVKHSYAKLVIYSYQDIYIVHVTYADSAQTVVLQVALRPLKVCAFTRNTRARPSHNAYEY